MKMLIAAAALAAIVIAPAFTRTAAAGPNDVFIGGKNIGQDPDANVRLQLRRDFNSENY